MKKLTLILSIIIIIVLAIPSVSAIDISACGNIVGSGTYNLTQNLTTITDCLKVLSDDVIINMNGYTISGDGGSGDYGIDNAKNNLTVNGKGTITTFDKAICSEGDDGNFNDLTITSNNFGIHIMDGSYNNVIENNNITINHNGIYVAENSGNIIQNNILTLNNNSIFFFGSLITVDVTDSSIINNTILSSGRYGIYLFRSSNITIENNIIHSTARDAIFSSFSSNNTIINNDLWDCCSAGTYSFIYLHESSYNTFENNRLNYSLNYGIWLKSTQTARTSSHNLFKDMNITDINNIYVLSTSTGSPATFNLNNTFLNVTYNNESIDANSQLVRQWYYRANVTYLNGTAVDNLILDYYNVSNDFQFQLITNANGLTDITAIIEYVNTNQNKGYYSNYIIQANKTGCEIIDFSYNVSENLNNLNHIMQFSCIEIDDPPVVSLISPADDTTTNETNIYFNCSATDDFQLDNITLYHNLTGIFTSIETKDLSGTLDSALFNDTINCSKTIVWNCLAYDNASQSAFASANYTLTISEPPSLINLTSLPNNSVSNNGSVDFSFYINQITTAFLYINNILNQSIITTVGDNTFSTVTFTQNQTIEWFVNESCGGISETWYLILNLTEFYIPPSPREDEYVLGVCPVDTLPRAMLFMFFVMLGFVIMGMGYALKNGLIGTIGSLFLIGTGVFMWYCLAFVSLLMMMLGLVMMSMFIFKGIKAFR